MAALASASACRLRSLGIQENRTVSKRWTRAAASAASWRSPGCLIFQRPVICSMTSLESMVTSTSVAPRSAAAASPAISPEYSATLLVATPIEADRSASTAEPRGSRTTAP
jgi:hypothetical protein